MLVLTSSRKSQKVFILLNDRPSCEFLAREIDR